MSRISCTIMLFLFISSAPVRAELLLVVEGLPDDLEQRVVSAVEPPAALMKSADLNPLWLERYIAKIPQQVRTSLEPFGYYHAEAQVDSSLLDAGTTKLRIRIATGPAIRLEDLRISLVETHPDRPLLLREEFPLQVGDLVREDVYEKGKSDLIAQVRDQGFLEARYTRHELQIDRGRNIARIHLEIAAGARSHFGEIRFHDEGLYPERFLRRYLTFSQGEPFSYREMSKTQQHLRNSDRFRKVLVVPRPLERQGTEVPVDIELEERKRYTLRPGVGFGTDTGARAVLRYRDRNAWHLGHEFRVDLLVAQKIQNYTTSYFFPSYRDRDTGLSIHGGYRAEQLDSYDNRYVFTEVEQTYGFGHGRVGSLFARAQYEHSDISADSVFTGFLLPGVRYSEAQLPESTGKGYGFHLNLEARATDRRFFSDISLAQLLASGDILLPLPWRMSTTLRLQAAGTLLDNPFSEVPASLRFFAGGDRSVRGYAYQSLGPLDENGDVVGGKHLVTGSVELTRRISKNWGLAIFVDAGNAFDSWEDYELAVGAGVGLRYGTPVGPIQLDVASPVSTGSPSPRLHIGVGFGW